VVAAGPAAEAELVADSARDSTRELDGYLERLSGGLDQRR
jgi:hypothetical protein